jgi:signal transduction histidine kinase
MEQLLSIAGTSGSLDIVILAAICVLIVFLSWFVFHQRRKGKELSLELEQLNRMKENNVESEFVLKAMKLITWHLNPQTMELTYDSDFRDKSTWMTTLTDGETTQEVAQQIHPNDVEHLDKALSNLCEGRTEDYHVEYRIHIPHTDKYYWEESYATIAERDMDGKPTSIVGTTQIIDDRKNMEAELIAARNRAEESDRLKSAFLANMSHEIRTPLNAIVGFTSVLPDITDPEERQGLLELLHENTQKLLVIINDVVNISKIDSGQAELTLSQFDLNKTLTELANKQRKELKKKVKLDTAFGSEQLTVTTDRSRLCEIVKHLLSNAAKFTDEGSITLGYDTPEAKRLHLWVRDTGIGIAPEHLKQVFERFFKVDEFVPGVGLGLSICQTMASSMGGNINVKSQLGKGSTFTLDIPIQ